MDDQWLKGHYLTLSIEIHFMYVCYEYCWCLALRSVAPSQRRLFIESPLSSSSLNRLLTYSSSEIHSQTYSDNSRYLPTFRRCKERCIGGAAIRASDFWPTGHGFDSRSRRYQAPRSTQPSIPPSTSLHRLGLRRGAPACVGWQVRVCDPIWQATPCSSDMCFH